MWLISINIQLSNRKFLIFSFQFFTFSFVHFCFLSVSEARSFLLYSKYKGRKILAIEFKHLHSKLFHINLVDFSFKYSSEKAWIPRRLCPLVRRLCPLVRRLSSIFFHVLQFLIIFSPVPGCYFGTKSQYVFWDENIFRFFILATFFKDPWDAYGVKNQDLWKVSRPCLTSRVLVSWIWIIITYHLKISS